jgi:hypothetical protein
VGVTELPSEVGRAVRVDRNAPNRIHFQVSTIQLDSSYPYLMASIKLIFVFASKTLIKQRDKGACSRGLPFRRRRSCRLTTIGTFSRLLCKNPWSAGLVPFPGSPESVLGESVYPLGLPVCVLGQPVWTLGQLIYALGRSFYAPGHSFPGLRLSVSALERLISAHRGQFNAPALEKATPGVAVSTDGG